VGCQISPQQDIVVPPSYSELISLSKNETKGLPDRYQAASKAEAIALQQQNTKLQIESLRMMGMLLLRMDSMDKATPIYRNLVTLATNEKDRESEGIACNNLALIKNEHSEYDSAILFYEQANSLFRAIGDSVREVQCKINMGIAYKNIGAFEKAFSISVDAARIMKKMNANDELAIAYTTLGNTLKDMRSTEEALSYHLEALRIREKISDKTINNLKRLCLSTSVQWR
jgi:tetratricopeptide (TPR) repeat protein